MLTHPVNSPIYLWPIARYQGPGPIPEGERRYWGGDKALTVGVVVGVSLLFSLPMLYWSMKCVVRKCKARKERKEARDLERQASQNE
ncbi:hypothetical protein ACJ41O_010571 [Fusarium nematophilum]